MVAPNRATTILAVLAIAASLVAGWLAGRIVERRTLADIGVAVAADARLRQNLLDSEVSRFRLLPVVLSGDSDLAAALNGVPGAATQLDRKLEALARTTGAAVIYAMGRDGRAIAASNWRTAGSFVGRDFRSRPYYRSALRTGSGEQFALGRVSRRPGFYLSHRSPGGGVIIVKLEFGAIEREWAAAGGITWVTNRAGIILVSSRSDWRFAAMEPLDARAQALALSDLEIASLRRSPVSWSEPNRATVDGERTPVTTATTGPNPDGWTVNVAIPDGPAIATAIRTARLAAALAALLVFGFAWTLWTGSRRRRERTTALEVAVAERTAELRQEMAERSAIETRAEELREGLRQANRLATLGQITASVAHEVAQPVAAIRNYAATGERLLERKAVDDVRDNLRAIGRLAVRIGTVTSELRGFARKGAEAIAPVRLTEVLEGAQVMLKERLSQVAFSLMDVPADLTIMAGHVRLEQVIVIILQNAIEALVDRADAAIVVTMDVEVERVRLRFADNGPGIAAEVAERLFTPFVTSRPNGLGLGLVIAQDIMLDLGGGLRLVPVETGACFEVEVRRG